MLLFKSVTNRNLLTGKSDATIDRPFKCSNCECTYISRRSLRKHEKTAHVPGGKKCPKCSCSFPTNQARKSHHTKMHVKTLLTSLQTSRIRYRKQFSVKSATHTTAANRIRQARVASRKDQGEDAAKLECPTCGKCFHSKPNLRQHLRIHSGRRYECELCHETFSLQSNMIRHQRTCHVEGGPFKCSQCTHCYSTTKGFKRHFAQAHGKASKKAVQVKQFPILKKENNYDGMIDVTYHRPSQLASQKLMNRQPSKIKFNFRKPNLPNKPVQLSLSRNSTTSSVVVKKPQIKLMTKLIALVTGDDSPQPTKTEPLDTILCTSSLLRATSSSNVPSAATPSSSSGAPVCQVCSKRFVNSHTLRAHMSVHTGERPHKCDLCGLNFRQKGDIVSHKKTNHVKDGNYKCSSCPCRFISSQGLKRHFMQVHNKSPAQNVVLPNLYKQIPHRIVKIDQPTIKQDHQQHNKVTLKFANNTSITKKMTVSQPRKFSCDLCSAAFNYLQNLTRHRKNSHVPSGQYKCIHCTCSFISPTSLRTHEAIFHRSEKKSSRKVGTNSSKSVPMVQQPQRNLPLNKHIDDDMYSSQELSRVPKIVRSGSKKLFLCQLCGASFKSNANCANHISVSHVDGGIYACGQCPCIFSAFKGLKRHEGIYHNARSKNLKLQTFSNLKQGQIKIEQGNYHDEVEEDALQQFEIYNDNEEDDDDYGDEGEHFEIYNDIDVDDDYEDADEQPLDIYDDDGEWDDQEEEESVNDQMTAKMNLAQIYQAKGSEELPRRQKQVIFDKDFGDEEEILEVRHLDTSESDPLDFEQEDDDLEGYDDDRDDGDYSTVKNNAFRTVKLELQHQRQQDEDDYSLGFHPK